jgi:hypothetical protein
MPCTRFLPYFVTMRRNCATCPAPANPIQADASAALIVRRARRPWPVLTAETKAKRLGAGEYERRQPDAPAGR